MTHTTRRQFSHLLATLVFAPLGLASLGCQSLDFTSSLTGNAGDKSAVEKTAAEMAAAGKAPAAHPQCAVELRSEGRKATRVSVPLNQETHVQDALVQSGAVKKFRRMNVELYRRTPAGKSHKMAVAYDSTKRQVEFQNDYFLKPDDVLVVTEDTSTMLDDMFRKASGNLPMLHRGS
ncbi:MAG: hypothetical protein ACKPEY_19975 [Planctomycetota bacterium]